MAAVCFADRCIDALKVSARGSPVLDGIDRDCEGVRPTVTRCDLQTCGSVWEVENRPPKFGHYSKEYCLAARNKVSHSDGRNVKATLVGARDGARMAPLPEQAAAALGDCEWSNQGGRHPGVRALASLTTSRVGPGGVDPDRAMPPQLSQRPAAPSGRGRSPLLRSFFDMPPA